LPRDREPFAALNADPRVMKHFPGLLSREQSDDRIERFETEFERHGFGIWAVEVPKVAGFIGFVGLTIPRFRAHFTPCVEIGWRLAVDHWNLGFASEAARSVVRFGFESLQLDEIVAFTVVENRGSRRVMEKIEMTYESSDDFDHPTLPEGHPLRPHVLYRIRR